MNLKLFQALRLMINNKKGLNNTVCKVSFLVLIQLRYLLSPPTSTGFEKKLNFTNGKTEKTKNEFELYMHKHNPFLDSWKCEYFHLH